MLRYMLHNPINNCTDEEIQEMKKTKEDAEARFQFFLYFLESIRLISLRLCGTRFQLTETIGNKEESCQESDTASLGSWLGGTNNLHHAAIPR